MSRAVVLFLLLIQAQAVEPPLLAAAQRLQAEAEAELAQGRVELAEQRRQAYAALAQAQERLSAARAAADAAATALAEARAAAARREQAAQHAAARMQRLRHYVGGLIDGLPADDDPAQWAAVLAAARTALVAALDASARISLSRETVRDRQGHPVELPVLRLAGAALAIAAEPAASGWLRPLGGAKTSGVIAGPALDAQQHAVARQALDSGRLLALPVDVSASLIDRPPAEPWSWRRSLAAGGVFVWPILAVALLALVLVAERLVVLWQTRPRPALAQRVLALLAAGEAQPQEALTLVQADSSPTARIVAAALAQPEATLAQREASLEAALLEQAPRLERSLGLLAALAAVAPLLGLLGTVTGMIGTFQVIALHGTGNPRLLSGGISEALVTTQMGLLAAVPILIAHAWLGRAVERRQTQLEALANALLGREVRP